MMTMMTMTMTMTITSMTIVVNRSQCGVQEKWRLRQEENRVRAAESSLEQERLRLSETIQRERLDLEAARVGLILFVNKKQVRTSIGTSSHLQHCCRNCATVVPVKFFHNSASKLQVILDGSIKNCTIALFSLQY